MRFLETFSMRPKYRFFQLPLFKNKGVTILEIIVILIILGIGATISFVTWEPQVESEYAYNAKITLKSVWQAEQNYFAWKSGYSNDWNALEISDPNTQDRYYNYEIVNATAITLLIKATRKGQSKGFIINQNGNISSF